MEDRDIIPPPPLVDAKNLAGGQLNRYDASTGLQLKVLCVGMYGTGKSTFLNRWQTNLKTKTRTTINIDFYEKHVDGFFPIILQPKPDPAIAEAEDSIPNPWAKLDFPSSTSNGKVGLTGMTTNYLVTQSNFGQAPSDSENDGSPTSAQASLVAGGGLLGRNNGGIGQHRMSGSNLGTSPNVATSQSFPVSTPNNTDAGSTNANESIPLRNYRNPRFTDATPNVFKVLTKASEVAKKARASVTTEPAPDRLQVLQRGTQRRPLAESDGAQVLSIYTLTRELGTLSGSGRSTMELYGLTQILNDVRRNVRDPRQVAACAMNTNFGYSYYERKALHVQCWDIQGQEHSRNMTRTYYTDAFAALVFVDITRPESLADAILWREDIAKKVYVKTATDASLENNGAGAASGAKQGASATAPSRHGRGGRPGPAKGTDGKSPNTPSTAANTASGELEEECHIPCWLVLNKCDLMDSKTHQFPNKEAWLAQTQEYKDLDEFCARNGFVGWSLASAMTNVNVSGIMDRVVQQCCNQFSREIYRFSTRGKQNFLQAPKPKPKQQKKCCATK